MTERDALMRAILDNPDDDTVRLVFADWLRENGENDRAEFIQAQIELARRFGTAQEREECGWGGTCVCRTHELTRLERRLFTFDNIGTWFRKRGPVFDRHTTSVLDFRELRHGVQAVGISAALVDRGFIDEIQVDLRWLFGDICEGCYNREEVVAGAGAGAGYVNYARSECPACNGEGRTDGCAAKLFSLHPVRKVALPCRRPIGPDIATGDWSWVRDHGYGDEIETQLLPPALWNALTDYEDNLSARVYARRYPTEKAATEALSAACVRLGRKLAADG